MYVRCRPDRRLIRGQDAGVATQYFPQLFIAGIATVLLAATPSAIAQLEAPQIEASEAPAAEPRRRALPSRGSALVNTNEAKRRLAQTERKRRLGKEPLGGEITQGPGGTMVSYRYWQRQEKLRIEVERAQHRVNVVQRPLPAQRPELALQQ